MYDIMIYRQTLPPVASFSEEQHLPNLITSQRYLRQLAHPFRIVLLYRGSGGAQVFGNRCLATGSMKTQSQGRTFPSSSFEAPQRFGSLLSFERTTHRHHRPQAPRKHCRSRDSGQGRRDFLGYISTEKLSKPAVGRSWSERQELDFIDEKGMVVEGVELGKRPWGSVTGYWNR